MMMPNLQSYKLSAIARGDKELVEIIETAERVPELERKHAAGELAVKKFKETTAEAIAWYEIAYYRNQRYRQALEFYADEYNWHEENTGSDYQPYYESDASQDGGEKARKALEESE